MTWPGTVDIASHVRYTQIDRQSVANFTSATVTLYYDSDDVVTDYTNLTVVKTIGAGTTWFDIGGTATANTTGNIVSGPFTSFSTFSLGNLMAGSNPLPIELLSFTGHCDNNHMVLKWSTATETNNDFFTLERSTDIANWEILDTVDGAGNSSNLEEYEFAFSPRSFQEGSNERWYYRLKQTDFNGEFEYSNVIAVENCGGDLSDFIIYPNPTKGKFNFFYNGDKVQVYSTKIYNLLGERVHYSGSNQTVIDLSDLQHGIYIVHCILDTKTIIKKIMLER